MIDMKKTKLLLMAAALVCGASVLTSCSDAKEDNPVVSSAPMGVNSPDGFEDIDIVLADVDKSETVVFLLRHGERGTDYSSIGELTDKGKQQARDVGVKIKNDEKAFYAHSDYIRTKQTCDNIAVGRGDTLYKEEEWKILSGDWYKKDALVVSQKRWDSWYHVSRWEYGFEGDKWGKYSEGYYDLAERSKEWLDSLSAYLPNMNRINVLVSHDMLVSAMTVYVTQQQIDLRYYKDFKWLNYLAGIAIIIDPEGNMRFKPVRGLNKGVM